VNVFSVGKPVDVSQEQADKQIQSHQLRAEKTLILHAPSNRLAKGTDLIEAVIGQLQSEGCPIEYMSLGRVSNAEVLRAISLCDLVIDQVYSDVPTPTMTLEACLMGKPVIVGGFNLDHFSDYFGGDLMKAIRLCRPEELRENVMNLVGRPEMLVEMSTRAKAFADEFCDPSRVAKNYLRLIAGDVPENWFFDPASVDYPWGVGQSQAETLENIKGMISMSGRSVLGLELRPRIWTAYCQAAEASGGRLER
jgi:hypothetical protein